MKNIIATIKKGFEVKVTAFIMVILVVVSFILSADNNGRLSIPNLDVLDTNWVLDGDEVTLPIHVPCHKNSMIQLNNQLPVDIKDESVLCYQSNFCVSRVYIDGVMRYSYGEISQLPFGNMVGDRICAVPLTKADSGKMVTVEFIPTHSMGLEISAFHYGTKSQLFAYVLIRNIWKIAISGVFLVFVLVSLIVAIKQKRVRGRVDKVGMLKSYALFTFVGIIWLLSSSELPQLFTDASEAVTLISYLSLAFIPVPYAYFCREVFKKGRYWFRALYRLGCFVSLFVAALFVCNIADTHQTLWVTHIYLVLVMIISMYYTFRESKTNELVRRLKNAILILAAFAVIGFAIYYRRPSSGYDAVAFGIGFTIYSAILFSITVSESEKLIQEIVRVDIYKELAYKDVMTKLNNRAAFEEALKGLIDNNDDTRVAVILFDLNDLKKTNDGIGHQAGDELIMGIAGCISEIFGEVGKSYRIGGDEFVTIIVDSQIDIEAYFDAMDSYLEKYNATHTCQLSAARGYAIEEVRNITQDSLATFIHCADEMMYEDKRRYKDNMVKGRVDES